MYKVKCPLCGEEIDVDEYLKMKTNLKWNHITCPECGGGLVYVNRGDRFKVEGENCTRAHCPCCDRYIRYDFINGRPEEGKLRFEENVDFTCPECNSPLAVEVFFYPYPGAPTEVDFCFNRFKRLDTIYFVMAAMREGLPAKSDAAIRTYVLRDKDSAAEYLPEGMEVVYASENLCAEGCAAGIPDPDERERIENAAAKEDAERLAAAVRMLEARYADSFSMFGFVESVHRFLKSIKTRAAHKVAQQIEVIFEEQHRGISLSGENGPVTLEIIGPDRPHRKNIFADEVLVKNEEHIINSAEEKKIIEYAQNTYAFREYGYFIPCEVKSSVRNIGVTPEEAFRILRKHDYVILDNDMEETDWRGLEENFFGLKYERKNIPFSFDDPQAFSHKDALQVLEAARKNGCTPKIIYAYRNYQSYKRRQKILDRINKKKK